MFLHASCDLLRQVTESAPASVVCVEWADSICRDAARPLDEVRGLTGRRSLRRFGLIRTRPSGPRPVPSGIVARWSVSSGSRFGSKKPQKSRVSSHPIVLLHLETPRLLPNRDVRPPASDRTPPRSGGRPDSRLARRDSGGDWPNRQARDRAHELECPFVTARHARRTEAGPPTCRRQARPSWKTPGAAHSRNTKGSIPACASWSETEPRDCEEH